MKSLSKTLIVVAMGLIGLVVAAFSVNPVSADSPGQLGGGAGVYQVKNLTNGGSYASTVTAEPCDELQYSIRLHNAAFGGLTDIVVDTNLPSTSTVSNVSTVTATPAEGAATGTNGTATVNLSSAKTISYSGPASLYSGGNVIKTFPQGDIENGINIGDLNGSTTVFVNFKAKVSCPEVEVCPPGTTGTPPNCVQILQPSVVCDSLAAEVIGSTNVPAKIKFTAKGTARNGATITGYAFDFGDGAKQDSTNASVEHTYNKEGDYKATVQVKSSLGITAVSANCSVTIKVTKEKPPVVVPPVVTPPAATPAQLPATGPVAMLSGLLGTTSLGFGVRQWLASRRRLSGTL